MTPNETIRLALYRFLNSSGAAEWRQVNLPQMSQVTGCGDWNKLVECLKYFRSEGFIDLRSSSKQPYPSVWGDRQFFQPYFEIKVVGKGFDDFAHLDIQEKAEEKALLEKPLVFISCGQCNDDEIQLGQNLADAVSSLTPAHGYFAQNQTSLEGLSRHIFGAINKCVGFVAVMHHRGLVKSLDSEHTRGSVWIEQELAIAAFLTQIHQRTFPVRLYVQKGIKIEGVRAQVLSNPQEFEKSADVLSHFRESLQTGRFAISSK